MENDEKFNRFFFFFLGGGGGKWWYFNQEQRFYKVLVNFLYATLSGVTVLIYVISQQNNCLMELYTNLTKLLFFMKMHLKYVRAKMIVYAFIIELDQLHYWYPRKLWNYRILHN